MFHQRFPLLFAIALFSQLLVCFSTVRAEESIRIGATLPLSGPLATYGSLIRGGIELAAEDLKAEGITTKLFFEDTPVAGAAVLKSLGKLIQNDKIDGIAGNFSNVAMATMAGTLEAAKIPAFHSAAIDPTILESGRYILTTNVRIEDEASEMATFIHSKLGLTRIAVLTIQTNFGQAYRSFFVSKFKRLGGEVVSDESFDLSDTDFKTQLLRIRESKPQAVYAACFGPFLGKALKQGREMGIKTPFFSVYESEDDSVLTAAQGSADGLKYFVTSSKTLSDRFDKFRSRFIARFKFEPGTFGANSYDATLLLGRALKACNRDRQCALEKLYQTRDFDGVSGVFSIAPDGAPTKRFFLKEVKGNVFVDSSL